MTYLSLAALAASFIALPAAAAEFSTQEFNAASKDPKAYTLDATTFAIERVGPAVNPVVIDPPAAREESTASLELAQIVNIGHKIWRIIAENKPVVEVSASYATALPANVKHWTSMGGWQPPAGEIYHMSAKNLYGIRVVDLRYQVMRTAGGNYRGVGKYLTAVTVTPLLVSVSPGYRFDLDASVPDASIVNVGTSESPVAAMTAQLSWRIRTAIKDIQGNCLYNLQGDGALREIGGPFTNRGANAARSVAQSMGVTLRLEP